MILIPIQVSGVLHQKLAQRREFSSTQSLYWPHNNETMWKIQVLLLHESQTFLASHTTEKSSKK